MESAETGIVAACEEISANNGTEVDDEPDARKPVAVPVTIDEESDDFKIPVIFRCIRSPR